MWVSSYSKLFQMILKNYTLTFFFIPQYFQLLFKKALNNGHYLINSSLEISNKFLHCSVSSSFEMDWICYFNMEIYYFVYIVKISKKFLQIQNIVSMDNLYLIYFHRCKVFIKSLFSQKLQTLDDFVHMQIFDFDVFNEIIA